MGRYHSRSDEDRLVEKSCNVHDSFDAFSSRVDLALVEGNLHDQLGLEA